MKARSALFDIYGDHLRARGGAAPVAALVDLLEPLGVKAPAVRTAISRMVKQGWLTACHIRGHRGYSLTPRATRRLDEAAARIYRTSRRDWDGKLDMVMFAPPVSRQERGRLADALRFHGYGPLAPGTWISPWRTPALPTVFAESDVAYDRFTTVHHGNTKALVARAWDLEELARRYREFVAELEPVVGLIGGGTPDRDAYTARFQLVHAFRVFLFSDPGLPSRLLPTPWAGSAAAAFFDAHAARLRPAADRFVHECLMSR
ncbi:PaaX family transcriptional regulator C-terminal domain-containing protein [Stackebrandtia soli]|uniref:PaaX family transcriptional regulator n=1 Tax=Stackebrandtia soli TaxID=1892856 RepID=UPI0039E83692